MPGALANSSVKFNTPVTKKAVKAKVATPKAVKKPEAKVKETKKDK